MLWTRVTLTQYHHFVLGLQFGDDGISLLGPEVVDGADAVLVLNLMECVVVYHAQVHEVEQQGDLGIVVTR